MRLTYTKYNGWLNTSGQSMIWFDLPFNGIRRSMSLRKQPLKAAQKL
jgi:hypothetical protein